MSTPPKEPKPDEVRRAGPANLESTFLGVAPTAPAPPAAAGGAAPAGGSAIIATPMISVSDRDKRGAAAAPVAPHVSPQGVAPAPARPAGLQGGWQSAGVPRALGPEQTALHGSPAWPMPPQAPPAARQQPAAPHPAPQPAPAQAPAAASPAAVSPAVGPAAGLQHTALASEYLRGARDAVLGADPAPQRAMPAAPRAADLGKQTAYSPLSMPAPERPHGQELPAAAAPVMDMSATVTSGGPAPAPLASPPAAPLPAGFPAAPAAGGPPPTMGPPPTAELSSPGPIPLHTVAPGAIRVSFSEPEPGPSPRSMGTQASVAPPMGELGASFHGPMAPVIHQATPAAPAVAPAAHPSPAAHPGPAAPQGAPAAHAPVAAHGGSLRNAVPQALVGTMLDRTPSIPGGNLQQGGPPPPANPTLRFEQVPPPRSSLAQQATAFGLNLPIEHNNTTQWGRPAHDGKTKAIPGRRAKPRSQWRMIVLAVLALLSVVFAAFGPELRDLAMVELARRGVIGRGALPGAPADQATLTNMPSRAAAGPATTGKVEPAAANAAAPALPAAPAGAVAGTTVAAAGATPDSPAEAAMPAVEAVPVAGAESAPVKGKRGSKRRESNAAEEAVVAASPESKLAAEAGKHVLAARFAEALPLYRTLQRDYPQNTAYAAMSKVLEQKLGGGAAQLGAQQAEQPAGARQPGAQQLGAQP